MKKVIVACVLIALGLTLMFAGCGSSGGGPTGPENAPTLSTVTVNPTQANPGAIIIFYIDFVDIPGDLNGGQAWIHLQSQDGSYDETIQSFVSNAGGTSGRLTVSIELSPLVPHGVQLTCSIFVKDLAGNVSNTVYTAITVL